MRRSLQNRPSSSPAGHFVARASRWACLLVGLWAVGRSPEAVAKCRAFHIQVFPATSVALPINGRIVLDVFGLGPPEGRAPGLPMELRAGAEHVPLKAVETFYGAMGGVEVALVPAVALRPATRYELYFSDEDRPVPTDLELPDSGAIAWTTSATADHVAPRWRSAPKAGTAVYNPLGCGLEVFVGVSVEIDGEEAVQIFAEVRPLGYAMPTDRGRPMSYLLWPQGGHVEIGHGMCGGPFVLERTRRYSVKLTAVDAAGNKSPAPGRPVEIVGPEPRLMAP